MSGDPAAHVARPTRWRVRLKLAAIIVLTVALVSSPWWLHD